MELGADDRGTSTVLAVILLVFIAVSVAGVAYTYASNLAETEGADPVAGFVEHTGDCLAFLEVSDASAVRWEDLTIRLDGADRYGIAARDQVADDATWDGADLGASGPVESGQVIQVAVAEDLPDVRVVVRHDPSDAVLFRDDVTLPRADQDDPTAEVALTDGATISSFSDVTGTAQDPCSGAGETRVTVQRDDGQYLTPAGFGPEPHVYDGEGNDWQADLPDEHLTEADYTVTATPVDRAGREGAPETVTVTYDPSDGVQDPGHAYEDVDNDARYTDGTDIKIPDSEVHDGEYVVTDPPHGLVLPASVGAISANRITFDAGGDGHLIVDVDLTSTDERIELTGGTSVDVAGIRIDGRDEFVNVTAGTTIDGADARIDSDDEDVEMDAGGAIDVTGATLTSGDQRVELTAGGALTADDSEMAASERVDLIADGDIRIGSAVLDAEKIRLDASDAANTLHVQDADLLTEEDPADGDPACVGVDGTPSTGSVDTGC